MDNDNPKSGQLLDDLKSIRDLLEKYQLEPPVLTRDAEDDIPTLSEVIDPAAAAPKVDGPPANPPPAAPGDKPAPTPQRIDADLRKAAQLILQDVVNDFAPQIEAELRRRLEAHLKAML